jgi:acetyl esterase/lipase
VEDVVNQPADLRFVIDRLLGWDASDRPFLGGIDPARIGVMGLSLGGMTATMIAFDPQRRDPRIAAAVSIAGPLAVFGPPYFAGSPVPFLMIAGDADVVIDYAANAPLAVERVPEGALVSIAGASHVGFDDVATGIPRLFGDPDRFACWWLALTLDVERSAALLSRLDETPSGTLLPPAMPQPCRASVACSVMPAERQHAITTLAVGAFLDSRLSADPTTRALAATYLERDVARDFPEVRYASAEPRPSGPRAAQRFVPGCCSGPAWASSAPRASGSDSEMHGSRSRSASLSHGEHRCQHRRLRVPLAARPRGPRPGLRQRTHRHRDPGRAVARDLLRHGLLDRALSPRQRQPHAGTIGT